MKKMAGLILVLVLGLQSGIAFGAALAQSDLPGFLLPMFRNPYEYMFDESEQKVTIAVNNRSLTMFMGGIRGLLYYFSLRDCFAERLGLAPDAISYDEVSPIASFAGIPVFLKPAASAREFGRVNPAIVTWGYENLIPRPEDKIGGKTFQQVYTGLFQRFFRLMTEAYLLLNESNEWDTEAADWQRAMASPEFEALDFQEERYAGYLSAYAVERNGRFLTPAMAISFWIRRHLDGSATEIWEGLSRLVTLFDGGWFAATKQRYPSRKTGK